MARSKPLPALHQSAFKYKNFKRLQKDGGRAWIKDSQLQPTIPDAHIGLQTQHKTDSVKEG